MSECLGQEKASANEVVADSESMLNRANEYIIKLEAQLKEKTAEINFHIERCQFYEQALKNLTTFKQ